LAARAPALRPVWHTEVSEAWFFSTFSPRRLEDLLQTQMADVLDSIDWLVCFGEKVEAGSVIGRRVEIGYVDPMVRSRFTTSSSSIGASRWTT